MTAVTATFLLDGLSSVVSGTTATPVPSNVKTLPSPTTPPVTVPLLPSPDESVIVGGGAPTSVISQSATTAACAMAGDSAMTVVVMAPSATMRASDVLNTASSRPGDNGSP